VKLKHRSNGYGLKFSGPADGADALAHGGVHGVFIAGFKNQSVAKDHVDIRAGMQVLSINGTDLAEGDMITLKSALKRSLAKDLELVLRENVALANAYASPDPEPQSNTVQSVAASEELAKAAAVIDAATAKIAELEMQLAKQQIKAIEAENVAGAAAAALVPEAEIEDPEEKNEVEDSSPNEADLELPITKGPKGFGMALGNAGDGTYIVKAKAGGATAGAIASLGMDCANGLRIKSVNGVDVWDKPKKAAMTELKASGNDLKLIVNKVPAGFLAVLNEYETKQGLPLSTTVPTRMNGSQVDHEAMPKEFTCVITKGPKGFSMSLGNEGAGTYVVKAKKGGAGADALSRAGLDVTEGLRFRRINGDDVYDKTRKDTIRMIKEAGDTLHCVFTKELSGYPAVLEAYNNKLAK
jgi:hypothetical protein